MVLKNIVKSRYRERENKVLVVLVNVGKMKRCAGRQYSIMDRSGGVIVVPSFYLDIVNNDFPFLEYTCWDWDANMLCGTTSCLLVNHTIYSCSLFGTHV